LLACSLARSFALSLLNVVYKEDSDSKSDDSKSGKPTKSAVLPTTIDSEALSHSDRVLTLLLHVTSLVNDSRLTQHVLPAVIDR